MARGLGSRRAATARDPGQHAPQLLCVGPPRPLKLDRHLPRGTTERRNACSALNLPVGPRSPPAPLSIPSPASGLLPSPAPAPAPQLLYQTLEPAEEHPDCAFIEDTMVYARGTAVTLRLGHESRRGEVDAVR